MPPSAQWQLASTPPEAAATPRELGEVQWTPTSAVPVSGTDLDDRDWWYRCTFSYDGGGTTLRFEGLATIAQVWLNGELILQSENMFLRHSVDAAALLQPQNELMLCFRSLNHALAKKRPRPRWKTRLVRNQQLRWIRTSLIGRIPGWTPPVPIVGPWREITLGSARNVELRSYVDGAAGVVEVWCNSDEPATLSVGDQSVEFSGHGWLRVENAELWYPHTHGKPALYDCNVRFGDETIDCGRVGFRHIEWTADCELRVNDRPVFCRGACWTRAENIAQTLTLMRDAGANMIRVGGTMTYEHDDFYRLCDELGIMVWQDFMFANMDYPAGDAQFVANVRAEATQQLQRLRRHPAVVIYCGNSEIEQQAAMLGMPQDSWRNAIFAEVLPELRARLHPDSAYVPSSPSGGALPFHTGSGVTHYYGVGAYKRPVADARRARVRFTSETLGFANVPEKEVVDLVMQGDAPALHDPRWKERTPRDTGAGWDFEDVRDHYLRELFAADPAALRYSDTARYLELSRVVSGEVMSQVFSEWRSAHSSTHGGLVWFLQDFWPGAGWGVIDSRGIPKACFYYLKRVWQPQSVVITDEGLDGLHAHVVNDRDEPLHGTLEWTLLRDGHIVVANGSAPVEVAPRGVITLGSDAMLGAFYDVAYAYRFGPPKHDVTIATLMSEDGTVIAEAFHFPVPGQPKRATNATVNAIARQQSEAEWTVTLNSDRFLYAAHFDAKHLPSDNYFHLVPGRAKTVTLKGTGALRGFVEALNLDEAVRIES